MTIEYLWIEKYKCFEKQGLNFGGEYLFTIDVSQYSPKEIVVSSKRNPTYIKGFYNITSQGQVAYITNVTALVGKNGSGKTTLFDFIKGYFPDGEGEINTNCLFINRNSDGGYTLYSYNEHDVKIVDNTGLNLNIIPTKFETSSRITAIGTKPFRDVDIVFFSNIFDLRFENEVAGLYNISTNHLIRNEKNKLIENKTPQEEYLTDIQAYQNAEIDKQLRFVRYYYEKNNLGALPFALPDKLFLEWANGRTIDDIIKVIVSKLGHQDSEDFTNILESLRANMKLRKSCRSDNESYEPLIISFISYLTIHTIYCIFHYNMEYDLPDVSSFLYGSKSNMSKISSIKGVITNLESCFPTFKSYFAKLKDLLEHIIEDFKSHYIEYWKYTGRYFYHINSESIARLSEFLKLYFDTQIIEGGLRFVWTGLSSGQIALFNMYSRLHYLIDPPFESHIDRESILLLLDEPDVFLHPEWQRKFVKSLIEFIEIDYAISPVNSDTTNQRRIQIVFSTNNPLTLSDILPTNVVKLCSSSDGRCSKIMDCYEETGNSSFGANLYNLLNDAFFFDNGYIGSFAESKIKAVLDKIRDIKNSNGLNIDNDTMNEVRTLISAIGEPIIRLFLTKQLEDAIRSYKGDNNFLNKLRDFLVTHSEEG